MNPTNRKHVVGALAVLALGLGVATPAYAGSGTVTVILTDSSGAGLAGGLVQYYKGGWQDLGTTDGTGTAYGVVSLTSNTTDFQIRYAGGTKKWAGVNVTETPTLSISTIPVTVKLETCGGTPLVGEAKYYYGGWTTIGNTPATIELLPYSTLGPGQGSYDFQVVYGGRTSATIRQDVSVDAVVVFKTTKVTLFGSNILYYNDGWKSFTPNPMEMIGGPGKWCDFKLAGASSVTVRLDIDGCSVEYPYPSNEPPVANPGGPHVGVPGVPISFDGTGSSDPDGDPLTYAWTFGDGSTGTGATPTHSYLSAGMYNVCLTVNDGTADSEPACTIVVVNQSPIADPGGPYVGAVGVAIPFDGTGSSDPDGDPLTYAWTFGDESTGTGATPTHSYLSAGMYNVCLTVNDGTVNSQPVCATAVVYDPSAGFVTGGGWIWSLPGAYRRDLGLEGKANFGFIAKYKKGATVPDGQTEFVFKAGDLNFHSTSYDWLVVTGSDYAMFKGVGTINGFGAYKFMIWAGDSDPDTFRIKIWTEDEFGVETVEYDNGMNQAIGGGSIVIHAK